MANHLITLKFLAAIDPKTRDEILGAAAKHYGITLAQALEEVSQEGAEQLLEYLTGPVREATGLLMRWHGCA